jgi:hypothetical protein
LTTLAVIVGVEFCDTLPFSVKLQDSCLRNTQKKARYDGDALIRVLAALFFSLMWPLIQVALDILSHTYVQSVFIKTY